MIREIRLAASTFAGSGVLSVLLEHRLRSPGPTSLAVGLAYGGALSVWALAAIAMGSFAWHWPPRALEPSPPRPGLVVGRAGAVRVRQERPVREEIPVADAALSAPHERPLPPVSYASPSRYVQPAEPVETLIMPAVQDTALDGWHDTVASEAAPAPALELAEPSRGRRGRPADPNRYYSDTDVDLYARQAVDAAS